jgi:tetratricopeptide (TPR) repeat protein
LLLARAEAAERDGRIDAAAACLEVLAALSPENLRGRDWFARLAFRRGDLDRAADLLSGWARLAPADPLPLVRLAVVEAKRGLVQQRHDAIERALSLTSDIRQAEIAYLGAGLALRAAVRNEAGVEGPSTSERRVDKDELWRACRLLERCLEVTPGRPEALAWLVAARALLGDRVGLAVLAPRLQVGEEAHARVHYLGALCSLAAGDYEQVAARAGRAVGDATFGPEAKFLIGLAHFRRADYPTAFKALLEVGTGPARQRAAALIGMIQFKTGAFDSAAACWQSVERAADRFSESGRLGQRDRRLGPLLVSALFKAGQQLLDESAAAARSESAATNGRSHPPVDARADAAAIPIPPTF